MKIIVTLSFLLFFLAESFAQNLSSDYKSIVINRCVKEFPDKFDLSTPLNAGLSIYYIMINGTENLWRDASAERIKPFFQPDTPNINISQEQKEKLMNDSIKEVIIYKDSVAYFITSRSNSRYIYRSLIFENGKWVNNGEDSRNDIQSVRNLFKKCRTAYFSK